MLDSQSLGARLGGAIAASLGVALGIVILRGVGALERLELAAYDEALQRRPRASDLADRIVLVRIGEDDLRTLGHPLCDAVLVRGLESLLDAGVRVVGVDLYRDPRNAIECDAGAGGLERRSLLEMAALSDRLVFIERLDGAPPDWRGAVTGFPDLPVDRGGVVRRGLLFAWRDDVARRSFALQVASRYLVDEGIRLGPAAGDDDRVRLGATDLPAFRSGTGGYARADDRGYQLLLSFPRGRTPFPSLGFGDLLDESVDPARLRGRIAIVGTAAPTVSDYAPTPITLDGAASREALGMELHAHLVEQLVTLAEGRERPITAWSEPAEAAWILLWSVLGAGLGAWRGSVWLRLAAGATGLLLLAIAGGALLARGLWIPAAPAALAGGLSGAATALWLGRLERRERREVARLFSRFVRPQVAEELWRERRAFLDTEEGRPRTRRLSLTVLFADLQGFTSASEKLDPQQLMGWLNEYMDAMSRLVVEHGGVVDDYAGDGLKANFGFPVPRRSEPEIADDARSAVRCALAMACRLDSLNRGWRDRGQPEAGVRLGIATGDAVAGALGGGESLKYTSIGDTVNVAARLEALERDDLRSDGAGSTWRILISEETHELLGDEFATEELGVRALRGRREPVRVYRVLGALRGASLALALLLASSSLAIAPSGAQADDAAPARCEETVSDVPWSPSPPSRGGAPERTREFVTRNPPSESEIALVLKRTGTAEPSSSRELDLGTAHPLEAGEGLELLLYASCTRIEVRGPGTLGVADGRWLDSSVIQAADRIGFGCVARPAPLREDERSVSVDWAAEDISPCARIVAVAGPARRDLRVWREGKAVAEVADVGFELPWPDRTAPPRAGEVYLLELFAPDGTERARFALRIRGDVPADRLVVLRLPDPE